MRGQMMDRPLLISSLIEHAGTVFREQEIVARTSSGPLHRYHWADARDRSKQLARALTGLEIREGDRIATLAWNDHRHLELYFAISGMGAVCHTLNPRLHASQLIYILNHAEDRLLFIDPMFVPLAEAILGSLESVERVVVMCAQDAMPEDSAMELLCYEDLLAGQSTDFEWPELDENAAASLCYTSGTTGNPKGVLFSHRSTVLHSWAACMPNCLGMGESTAILPVVPMFHANAWGIPYGAALAGAKLVFPGPKLDGASLTELMREEGVTVSAGVPTVWLGLLDYWRTSGNTVPTLKVVAVGGAAPARSMIEAFQEEFGIDFRQGWGMTEMSPIGSFSMLTPTMRKLPLDERLDELTRQGRPLFGVEMRIVDEEGNDMPADGVATGELLVRGPWVCNGYYREDESESHRDDGWFRTGDIARLGPDHTMHITDRAKDVIKSGGEWISSIALENLAMAHPDVAHAAVIGVPDEKWTERPFLIVVAAEDTLPTEDDILAFFKGKVADWWIPDAVAFVDELPLGGTGKVQKSKLRERFVGDKAAGAGT